MSTQTDSPSDPSNALRLDEFPPHSYNDWKEAAEKLLNGAPFEKRLVAKTYEGFELQPLYRQEDLEALPQQHTPSENGDPHLGKKNTTNKTHLWKVAQETTWTDPVCFNENVRNDIKNGLTEIVCPIGGVNGLQVRTVEDLGKAFKGIDLTEVALTFQTQDDALPFSALLISYLRTNLVDLHKVDACLTNDPLGSLAATGTLTHSLESSFAEMSLLTNLALSEAPKLKPIVVSGEPYANGGSSSSQELGYTLATGLFYLRKMQESGIDVSDSASTIRFSFSIGPHFFIEIAKLRAARILWSKIVAAMGGNSDSQTMTIHARTGRTNKTLYDPHVNILRSCTEALSAILGSCDSLTIAPFNELGSGIIGPARRIALNMHTLLAEECALNRVIDPGGGSYYLEHLTDKLARTSWAIFQSIERHDGMLQALKDGIPQAGITSKVEEKKKDITTRRSSLIGTNLYPNPDETLSLVPTVKKSTNENVPITEESPDIHLQNTLEGLLPNDPSVLELCIDAATSGANLKQIRTALRLHDTELTEVERIPPFRLSQDYEALRQASEDFAKRTGSPPQILQLNLGSSRRYRIRADWTSSFFQVGGIQVINDRDFSDVEAAVAAVIESKPALSIMVSDDDTYTEQAASLASAIKEAVPEVYLLLAGVPGENEEALRKAGIDGFIHIRLNNYETLKSILIQLGVIL